MFLKLRNGQEEMGPASPRKSKKGNAFTLIELLVVIAIIAVLVAILFPVFAQAKKAAKEAASISNLKQISTAILLYVNDADDAFVTAGEWGSLDPDASLAYPSAPYMPWTGLIEPYKKNMAITDSPLPGRTRPFTHTSFPAQNRCLTDRQCALLYPTYGYNATFLSPSYNPDGLMKPITTTTIEKPADQVMLTEIFSPNIAKARVFSAGPRFANIGYGTAEPPGLCVFQTGLTKPIPENCWGKEFSSQNDAVFSATPDEGLYTGAVAFRYAGQAPVAFADGHVRKMTKDKLAAGTNWTFGASYYNVIIVLNGQYLWNPAGNW